MAKKKTTIPQAPETEPVEKGNLQNVFEANPQAEQLFETADGQVFFTEDLAQFHAKNFEDKQVKTHRRDA